MHTLTSSQFEFETTRNFSFQLKSSPSNEDHSVPSLIQSESQSTEPPRAVNFGKFESCCGLRHLPLQEPGFTMDVAGWLRDLGLERYEHAFRENAVDVEVLPALTDADLEKLGVLLGHRKRLLKAIADSAKV
jgi:SAM domain (Sterile alpha motif)